MKSSAFAISLFLLAGLVSPGQATDESALLYEGSYLVTQDDKYQRVITLDRSGTVSQIANLESVIGFTAGQGAWMETGTGTVKAQVIDFAFNKTDGSPIGPARIVYEFSFSEEAAGKYQVVTGSLSGQQFQTGENPLDKTAKPIGTFEVGFNGQRINAE